MVSQSDDLATGVFLAKAVFLRILENVFEHDAKFATLEFRKCAVVVGSGAKSVFETPVIHSQIVSETAYHSQAISAANWVDINLEFFL